MKRRDPSRSALRAATAFTFIVSCSSGSDATTSEGVALDAALDPSGSGFTIAGTHFSGCEDFCTKEPLRGGTFVSCDGPVPVDPKTGIARFDDGGTDLDIFYDIDAGHPIDAVLCRGTFHNAPGCGPNVTSTGMAPESGL
jgi:hypothetical protein